MDQVADQRYLRRHAGHRGQLLDVRQKSLFNVRVPAYPQKCIGTTMHTMIEILIRWVEKPMLQHRLAERSLQRAHYCSEETVDPCAGKGRSMAKFTRFFRGYPLDYVVIVISSANDSVDATLAVVVLV